MILLIVVFAVLMIIGAPVGLSLLGSSVAYLVASGYSLQQAFQAFTSAISNSFTLIAVPFFYSCSLHHELRRHYQENF